MPAPPDVAPDHGHTDRTHTVTGFCGHRHRTPCPCRSGDVGGTLASALVRWPALVVLLIAVGPTTAGMAHNSRPTPTTR